MRKLTSKKTLRNISRWLCKKKFFKQQTALIKIDIFLLCESKIDDSFPDSKLFSEGFKMYHKDSTRNGGGCLLYVNENLSGKIINIYKFKENS